MNTHKILSSISHGVGADCGTETIFDVTGNGGGSDSEKPRAPCTDDSSCSGNGKCVKPSGECVCDPMWIGLSCGQMVILPATKPVDRLDASQLSYERFFKEYAVPGRPLVITNRSLFVLEYFLLLALLYYALLCFAA